MPNWCMNNVTINGSKEKLEEIIKACENDKFLEFLVPIGDWDYGSAIEAWGTKWEARDVDHDLLDDNTLMLNFDSAWGPPVTAYNTGEANHDITIYATYYEPGMAFVGEYEDSEDISYNIDFEDESWMDEIPEHLSDHWGLYDEYESWKEWQDEEE